MTHEELKQNGFEVEFFDDWSSFWFIKKMPKGYFYYIEGLDEEETKFQLFSSDYELVKEFKTFEEMLKSVKKFKVKY